MTMQDSKYAFPLSIQITLPPNYQDRLFQRKLELLQKFGFAGVELNIARPEQVDPAALATLLAGFNLKMTMFATGATAKAEGLSLSSLDDSVRQASVGRCIEFVDFAHELDAGVIVGYLKGGVSAQPERARECFAASLGEIEPHVRAREVPLLIEATNRYESAVANTLADTADLIRGFGNPYLRILPDTFHMNIEERSLFGALIALRAQYDSVHISDNNRFFPGLGGLDFRSILRFLGDSGYQGGVAIEGNVRGSFEQDLRASMQLIGPMLSSLAGSGPG
jgi:D-psicose/D-tagatose/L-ribulose 3-epimerase